MHGEKNNRLGMRLRDPGQARRDFFHGRSEALASVAGNKDQPPWHRVAREQASPTPVDLTAPGHPAHRIHHRVASQMDCVFGRAFLSQPFYVAEVFTGKSGEFTKIDDTIRSFEEICDGKWDHLPEDAFMYVGPIEQAEEQAKRLGVDSEWLREDKPLGAKSGSPPSWTMRSAMRSACSCSSPACSKNSAATGPE